MWQPRAGDHVPAMSAPRAFALTVKDAGTGACTVLRVAPTTTAAALKQRLLSDGIAPPASRKVHLAHNGRMLQDDETLEAAGLALVPTVVMACVAPAPTPAPPAAATESDAQEAAAAAECSSGGGGAPRGAQGCFQQRAAAELSQAKAASPVILTLSLTLSLTLAVQASLNLALALALTRTLILILTLTRTLSEPEP